VDTLTGQPIEIIDLESDDLTQIPSDEIADHPISCSLDTRNQQKIMIQNVRSMKDIKFGTHGVQSQVSSSQLSGKENAAAFQSSDRVNNYHLQSSGGTQQFTVYDKDINSSRKKTQNAGIMPSSASGKKGHHVTKSETSAEL
jgi:hypothetical protein